MASNDAVRIVPRSGAAALRARVAPAPGMDFYQRRVGNALTPQVVSAVLRAADIGLLYQQADLLDEVREKDGHLQSVMGKREQLVAGAEWELRPNPRTAKTKAKRIVDYCTDLLERVCGLSFAMADLQSAVYHGRAVLEGQYVREGRYWYADALWPVHARRCAYAPNDWRLRLWDQSSPSDSPFGGPGYGVPFCDLQRLAPGKFIVHTPRVRGGYPQREGLGRLLVWYAGVFKAFGWRDFLAYAEQYGRPLRFGVFGSGKDPALPQASTEDVDVLEEALENLSSSIIAVYPDTTKIQVENPAAHGETVHPELLRLCDEETSKAVLGGTLTTTGGTKGGNRSLGEQHKDEELMIARGDARAVAETLRDQFLTPMVLLAGIGERQDVPRMFLATDPPESLDALATRFKTAKETGVKIAQAHVRDRLGIPDPAPDEELLGEGLPTQPTLPGMEPPPGKAPPGAKKKTKPAAEPAPQDEAA